MNMQAIILKLCQGCADREAGQNACNARPTSMQEAKETIRWYQFISQSMFGKINLWLYHFHPRLKLMLNMVRC